MDRRRLEQIERYVLGFFQAQGRARVLANELFESTREFANADLVRALEDLEKKQRLLVRHTTEGNDYISLTPAGASSLGLDQSDGLDADDSAVMPHPPKSATR
jgi:hypothetical protein